MHPEGGILSLVQCTTVLCTIIYTVNFSYPASIYLSTRLSQPQWHDSLVVHVSVGSDIVHIYVSSNVSIDGNLRIKTWICL